LANADTLYAQGRYDLALRAYSKVLEYNSNSPGPWTAQVRMLVELEELREARLWVDKGLERFPDQPELLAAKAVVHAHMGDRDKALALSDGSIEERGNTPYVWLARGDVLLARGEKRAAYCFEQAMMLARGDWMRCWEASRVYTFHRNFPLAIGYANQATDLAPERVVTWLQAGRCHLGLNQAARARETLERARQIDPECPGLDKALQETAQMLAQGSFWGRLKRLLP
jgi:tetratricopeptide (TPR) repeat protein